MRASIIINNYNYGKFLRDAIESALQQTHTDTEVIVVDDGSTDESASIIHGYGKRIKSFIKENAGQASCFNAGFRLSTGEVIIFLDADDHLEKNCVSSAVEIFEDPSIVKVHWKLFKINPDGRIDKRCLPDSTLAEGNLREQLLQFGPSNCGGPPNSPPTSGNAWSRKFLEAVLPMPEAPFKGGADNYLFVLAPAYGMIGKINEPLGYYRIHGENNTVKPSYINTYFKRFDQCCTSLSEHLSMQGIQIDPSTWPRQHWYHKVQAAMEMVKTHIPVGSSFILIDDNHWTTAEDFYGRWRIPFTENHGEYAGPPANDKEALRELEKQRQYAASYVVIPWSCFWYFDTYKKFGDYLRNSFTNIVDHELVRIYALEKTN